MNGRGAWHLVEGKGKHAIAITVFSNGLLLADLSQGLQEVVRSGYKSLYSTKVRAVGPLEPTITDFLPLYCGICWSYCYFRGNFHTEMTARKSEVSVQPMFSKEFRCNRRQIRAVLLAAAVLFMDKK